MIASPCIQQCELDETRKCVGCGRTSFEIATWSKMTEKQKAQVIQRLEKDFARKSPH